MINDDGDAACFTDGTVSLHIYRSSSSNSKRPCPATSRGAERPAVEQRSRPAHQEAGSVQRSEVTVSVPREDANCEHQAAKLNHIGEVRRRRLRLNLSATCL